MRMEWTDKTNIIPTNNTIQMYIWRNYKGKASRKNKSTLNTCLFLILSAEKKNTDLMFMKLSVAV